MKLHILLILALTISLVSCAERLDPNDKDYSINHDGLTRTYRVYSPSYSGSPMPVVIYMHGGGGNKESAKIDGLYKYADKYNFILVAPEGTGEKQLGKLRAFWNGGKWATGECCGDADDVGFISEMIDDIKQRYNVDDKRIYVAGISNGGMMANRLGCELADKIAAIATVAPNGMPSECNPSRPISMMDIHGTVDPCNNFETGEATLKACAEKPFKRMTALQVLDQWRDINDCSDKFVYSINEGAITCISHQDCSKRVEVALCRIEGMGHAWPSGAQYLPENVIGPVNHEFSMDDIWKFFEKHPIRI